MDPEVDLEVDLEVESGEYVVSDHSMATTLALALRSLGYETETSPTPTTRGKSWNLCAQHQETCVVAHRIRSLLAVYICITSKFLGV